MAGASTARLDAAAIGLSFACMAHCLALPVAASFLPSLSAAAEAEWVHWLVLMLASPVAVLALRRSGTSSTVRVLAATGLATMLLGAAGIPSHASETPLTVAGGTALALAHVLNLLQAQKRLAHHHGDASGSTMSTSLNDRNAR